MILLAAIVAAGTLAVGLLVAAVCRRLPTVRLQLAVFGVTAALLPLVAIISTGVVMFDSTHDLTIVLVASAGGLAALVGAFVLGRSILEPMLRLRTASADLAAGHLGARANESGPAEVAEVARAFNQMGDRLEELFDARRQLVAWASHDLRTPLASLQAMLEAVEDGLAEPEDYLPAMRDQVTALGTLVDDLFELARLDSGALTIELRDAGIETLVESCLRGVEAEASARQISLETRIDGALPLARCAPDKVERVLSNLVRNALRHTPSDGAVAIVVRPDEREVVVEVEDTGEGFGQEALRRMFDRFWRGDRARSADGAGLGLAIARGLVEAQGGRIWAENRQGGGGRVCFTLPAAASRGLVSS